LFYTREESDPAQIEELNSTVLGILLHARSSGVGNRRTWRIPTTVLEEASATWDPHVSEIPWRSQSWARRVTHWADAQGFGWAEDRERGPMLIVELFLYFLAFYFLPFPSPKFIFLIFGLKFAHTQFEMLNKTPA
jgi:hypothetical protein